MSTRSVNRQSFRVDEIVQVAVVVKNLQKAMENYWKTLGIGPWSIYTYAPPALREPMVRGKLVNYSMRLAIAQVGSVQLELIEPLEGPSVYKEFLAERGEGLHHIQSRIENVDETLAAFKEMGINILMSGKFGEGEFYYMDTEPVLGTVYEVVKRRTRPPPETTYPPK